MTNENDAKAASDKIIDLDPDQVIDVDDTTTAKSSKTMSGRRRSYLPLWILAAALLGPVAGGWFYRDILSSYLPSNEMARVISKSEALEAGNAALREQLAALDRLSSQFKTDIDALEASLNTTKTDAKTAGDLARTTGARVDGVDVAITDLRTAQSALSDRIAKLQSAPPVAGGTAAPLIDVSAITQRLESLEKDVASLKSASGENASDMSALTQSFADLKAKFAAGAAFSEELARVQRMVPAAPGLEELARHASTGLPDAAALAMSLKNLASELKPSPEVVSSEEDNSWLGWATGVFTDIVTIRNAGDVDWAKTAGAAAAFAESGDLVQAIAHVAEAEGTKPPALQQWLETAQARVRLEASLAGVEAAVLRMLAAKE